MYEDKCTLSDCRTHVRTTSSEWVLWQFASGWESHFLQSTLQPKGKRVDQTIYALWRVHSLLCKTRRTFACFHWNRLYPERRGSWKRRRQKATRGRAYTSHEVEIVATHRGLHPIFLHLKTVKSEKGALAFAMGLKCLGKAICFCVEFSRTSLFSSISNRYYGVRTFSRLTSLSGLPNLEHCRFYSDIHHWIA